MARNRPPARRPRRRRLISSTAQKSIMFVVGLGLTVNEAVLRPATAPQRPYLVGLYALMMGIPVALSADELRNWFRRDEDDDDDDRGAR